MAVKVVKFGGSSLADGGHFQQVKAILEMDPQRAYLVPSAPGKRNEKDEKVTDLLYLCQKKAAAKESFQKEFLLIKNRYFDIAQALHLSIDLDPYFKTIENEINNGASAAYAASRGEYLNGLLLADYLGWAFLDPAHCIFFSEKGRLNIEKTNEVLAEKLAQNPKAVIPGFYGVTEKGEICTFSRGGSDITGAIVANAAHAEVYENWTDVCGFLMADPRVVENPMGIKRITYQELRELSYMGASVLHEDAIFPVHQAGIPTNIRNTNQPDHPGTWIEYGPKTGNKEHTITGLAGKKGFSVITIEKAMMNAELGFGRKVFEVLEEKDISFDHVTTGIDNMCVVVAQERLLPYQREVVQNILSLTKADTVTVKEGMALVATVGWGMVNNWGTAAKLFGALGEAAVNVRMIDQGSSELSIIVGVDEEEMEKTINAIYRAFVTN